MPGVTAVAAAGESEGEEDLERLSLSAIDNGIRRSRSLFISLVPISSYQLCLLCYISVSSVC